MHLYYGKKTADDKTLSMQFFYDIANSIQLTQNAWYQKNVSATLYFMLISNTQEFRHGLLWKKLSQMPIWLIWLN